MIAENKKYTLNEISIGMKATKESLSEIFDTWIFLTKENETDKEGRIVFIGKKTNEESDKVLKNNRIITPIYNDSDDLNGDIFYDD